MASKKIPGIHYDVTPQAQQYRRMRLEPEQIARHLRDWHNRDAWGAQFAALGLIEMTEYLQCSPTERVELIDRILGLLDEVTKESPETAVKVGH